MPTVPRYGDLRVREAPERPLATIPNAPEAAFGAGPGAQAVFQQVGGFAQDVQRIAEAERERADRIAGLGAAARLSRLKVSTLHDPATGALSRRGLAAIGRSGDSLSSFDEGAKEIEAGLATEGQRAAFRLRAELDRAELEGSLVRHEAAESRRVDDDHTTSFVENKREEAAAAAGELVSLRASLAEQEEEQRATGQASVDRQIAEWAAANQMSVDEARAAMRAAGLLPNEKAEAEKRARFAQGRQQESAALSRFDRLVSEQRLAISEWAGRNGVDAETAKRMANEAAGRTHAAVLNRLMSNKALGPASDYLAAHKDEMPAKLRDEAAKDLQSLSTSVQARLAADAAAQLPDRKAAREKVAKITDPAARELAERYVEHEFTQRRVAREEALDDLHTVTAADVQARPLDEFDSVVPPSTQRQLGPDRVRALRAIHRRVEQDDQAWLEFSFLPAAELGALRPSEFQTKYWSRLTPAHREDALAAFQRARRGDRVELSSMQTDQDIVANAFTRGVVPDRPNPKDWSDQDKLRFALYKDKVSSAVQSEELRKNRKLTDAEKQVEAAKLLARTVLVDRAWPRGNRTVPAALVLQQERGERIAVPFNDIPEAARAKVFNYAVSIGAVRPGVTRAEFEKNYREKIEEAYAADVAGFGNEAVDAALRR